MPKDKFDCAVLVALREEYEALKSLTEFNSASVTLHDLSRSYFDFVDAEGGRRTGAIYVFHEMGGRASDAAGVFLDRIDASIVVSLGIAAGISNDVGLGDVVCATSINNPVETGKHVDTGEGRVELQPGNEFIETGRREVNLLRNWWSADASIQLAFHNAARRAYPGAKSDLSREAALYADTAPSVLFLPGASGPTVAASQAYVGQLKRGGRKIAYYDMESYYIGRTLQYRQSKAAFLAIRGISDRGDAAKNALEGATKNSVRKWATQNAGQFLLVALRAPGLFPPQKRKSRTPTAKPAQPQPHSQWEPSAYVWRAKHPSQRTDAPNSTARLTPLEDRYRPLVSSPEYPSDVPLFASLLTALQETAASGRTSSMLVSGPKGTAKGTLLDCLFGLASGKRMDCRLLDLRRYRQAGMVNPVDQSSPEGIVEHLFKSMKPQGGVVFIDKLRDDDLSRRVLDLAAERLCTIPGSTLVGGANLVDHRTGPREFNWQSRLNLGRISVQNPDLDRFLGSFAHYLPQSGPTIADLKARIQEFNVEEIDPKFVSVLVRYWPQPDFARIRSLPELASYLMSASAEEDFSIRKEDAHSTACEIAYQVHLNQAVQAPGLGADRRDAVLGGLHWMDWVLEGIVATHVVDSLIRVGASPKAPDADIAVFRLLYQSRVCRYIKQVLDKRGGPEVLRGVNKLLNLRDVCVLPVTIYVLGRLTGPSRKEALRHLQALKVDADKLFSGWANGSGDDRMLLLARRAVYISLAYQGDSATAEEYARLISSDGTEASLNRGFHAEYYGDGRVDVAEGVTGYLLQDEGNGPWHLTLRQLRSNLEPQLANGKLEPKGLIELATFYSFVGARLEARALSDTACSGSLDLLDQIISSNARMPLYLKERASVLKALLTGAGDVRTPADVLRIILNGLKHEERAGWRSRRIGIRAGHATERVASHVTGALVLAHLLLPEKAEKDFFYSKQRVMNYLLLHDLGESICGDQTPKEKVGDPEAEARAVGLLTAYSLFPMLQGLSSLEREWNDFENTRGNDALVARDFDLLDAWLQGHFYRGYFPDSPQDETFDFFETYHRNKITTPPVLAVMNRLHEMLTIGGIDK